MSLKARNQQEVLIARPLEVIGEALQLNVDATRGQVRVGIASADPVPTFEGSALSTAPHLSENNLLPGFAFDDCLPVHADSVEHTVQFEGGASLGSLRGRSVCLFFQMIDADLYGFRLTENGV